MTRRFWLAAGAAGAAGCGRREPAPENLLPATADGSWRRTALRRLAPAQAPAPLTPSAVRRIEEAVYEGPGAPGKAAGRLTADLYRMASSASALDAAQHWRATGDSVFFYAGAWFVVVRFADADRSAVRAFVRGLEQRLRSPK